MEPYKPHAWIVVYRLQQYHIARAKALEQYMDLTLIEISRIPTNGHIENRIASGSLVVKTIFSRPKNPLVDIFTKAVRILQFIRETKKPDVIAIAGWSNSTLLIFLLYGIIHRIPKILLSASTESDKKRIQILEFIKSQIIWLFDAAIVGGRRQRAYICSLKFPSNRVFEKQNVIANHKFILQHENFINSDCHKDGFKYLLFVGRLVDAKNLHLLIDVFLMLKETKHGKDWKLHIVGDGPLRDQLTEYALHMNLAESVTFLGARDQEDLPQIYARATVFILPSLSEPWGLVVNEAMAAGLPVLVSDRCGCVDDLVIEGENGYTFDPNSIADCFVNLMKLCSHPEKMPIFGARSMQIINHYTPNEFAKNFVRAFNQIRCPE